MDSPALAEFVGNLEPVNALADLAPGFVWRLEDESGDATSIRAFDDERRHPDGGFEKCFCRECGAHLYSRNPEYPAQMSVRMSAFDGDPGVRPSWRGFVADAAVWEPIPDDGLVRYEGPTR